MNRKTIVFTGSMGAGKSLVAKRVGERLGRIVIELDHEIERYFGKPIPKIFEEDGEAAFRAVEAMLLRKFLRLPNVIISLGGGAFMQKHSRTLALANGRVIWLDAPIWTIVKRVRNDPNRPLAKDPWKLRRLYNKRRPLYAMAHARVDTSWRVERNLHDVLEAVKQK